MTTPTRFGVMAVSLAIVCGATFWAGWQFRPTQEAATKPPEPVRVLAEVETRPVGTQPSIAATINSAAPISLVPTVEEPAVVTRAAYSVGDTYQWGSLIGVVSGQPLFGLPAPLPLYRDLTLNDDGDDVKALQRSLTASGHSVDIDGVVGRETLEAVRAVFNAFDFDLAEPAVIPHHQLIGVGADGLDVVQIAEVGTRLGPDEAMIKLRAPRKFVTFFADAVHASSLSVGQGMRIQASMKSYEAAVTWVGPPGEKDANRPAGHEVRLETAGLELSPLVDGTSVTVSPLEEIVPTLAVPLSAIRQDSRGAYVEVQNRASGNKEFVRLSVEVLRTSEGWAAVLADGLAAGDKVAVG
jgi:hypothetical protein